MNDNEKLAGLIKDIKFTSLTTISTDGKIHSRPMVTLSSDSFQGTLWFFAKKESHLINEIQNDQHINLAYVNQDKQVYASVCGSAFISDDKNKMKELWNESLSTWFKNGLNDPQITLVGVNVESAELWGETKDQVVHLVDFPKSQGRQIQKPGREQPEIRH